MSHFDIVRAWKDEEYRHNLSDAERAALPANPAGVIELSAADLQEVVGGLARIPTSGRYSCTPKLCC